MRNIIILSPRCSRRRVRRCAEGRDDRHRQARRRRRRPSARTTTSPTPGKPAAAEGRSLGQDAKKDYQAAIEFFRNQRQGRRGTSRRASGSADKFSAVVREHTDLVAAQFMVGLSLPALQPERGSRSRVPAGEPHEGRPDEDRDGALEPRRALLQAPARSTLRKQYWDSAIKANGKLIAARINVASMNLEQMRKIGNPKDAQWKKLEEDARFNLSNALGVDTDSVEAYTVFGLVYMEGWQQNKNRLDLAKTLLDEAKKRNEKYPPLQNAYGLYWMHKGSLNQALQSFQAAVEGDPKFVEARINAGLLTLGFRKYDTAKEHVQQGRSSSRRRTTTRRSAWASRSAVSTTSTARRPQYKKAKADRPARAATPTYNLGVLYKDFRANKQNDPDQIKALRKSAARLQAGEGLLPAVPRQAGATRRQDRGEGEHQGLRQGRQAARRRRSRAMPERRRRCRLPRRPPAAATPRRGARLPARRLRAPRRKK